MSTATPQKLILEKVRSVIARLGQVTIEHEGCDYPDDNEIQHESQTSAQQSRLEIALRRVPFQTLPPPHAQETDYGGDGRWQAEDRHKPDQTVGKIL